MLLPNTVTSPLHHLITSSNPCSRHFGKAQLELTDCTANQLPFIIQNLKFNIIILHHSTTPPLHHFITSSLHHFLQSLFSILRQSPTRTDGLRCPTTQPSHHSST